MGKKLLIIMSSVLLLSSCGQYGGLYLPGSKKAPNNAAINSSSSTIQPIQQGIV